MQERSTQRSWCVYILEVTGVWTGDTLYLHVGLKPTLVSGARGRDVERN